MIAKPMSAVLAAIVALTVTSVARGADRIVTLVPSVTETLFALGVGDQVVGVSSYDDYPPEVSRLPKVGTFLTPNLEEIAALRPTLVIGRGISSNQREIRALNALGYETLMIEDDSLSQIEDSIRRIGRRVCRQEKANAIVG